MVGIINAGDYGRAIHDSWIRRQLIDLGEVMVNHAFGAEPELDGSDQIESGEQALFDLATRGGSDGALITFETALSFQSGANISEVARRNGVNRGLLWVWRKQARVAVRPSAPAALFAAVQIEDGAAVHDASTAFTKPS